MKVYKGTDKDMKCRGMQYELGKTEATDDAIRCGSKGFHSCEAPFDVFKYYPMRNGNRYFLAEADGKIDRTGADDSKIASSELTLKAEVKIADLIKAQVEFTRKKAETGVAGGNYSNLAGGFKSNLAGGDESVLVARDGARAKAGVRSVIVLTEWGWRDSKYTPVAVKAEIVDGERIKADTWYMLKNGEFVEVTDNA